MWLTKLSQGRLGSESGQIPQHTEGSVRFLAALFGVDDAELGEDETCQPGNCHGRTWIDSDLYFSVFKQTFVTRPFLTRAEENAS
ncbi:hypothetical protein CEXT_509101 [Caerostris extrusa]|uniref:Uncharacterized protein n=1 Tax=Caerostris extrusa TaxID=172846 RepID=A0AAV4NP94_CAEEX|nr:hypothetical protein CEXT_509101 [Caerostris extrusa]